MNIKIVETTNVLIMLLGPDNSFKRLAPELTGR